MHTTQQEEKTWLGLIKRSNEALTPLIARENQGGERISFQRPGGHRAALVRCSAGLSRRFFAAVIRQGVGRVAVAQ